MFYAVKFFSQSPDNEPFKLEGVPLDWPWHQHQIKETQVEQYQQSGWTVFTPDEYRQYLEDRQPKFDLWWSNREAAANETRLRVLSLVEEKFSNYHPSKIDFTIHLKPNVVLNKKVTMLRNGRPEKAEYFYLGEKICEIKFEFEVNAFNFMIRRSEKLAYVQGNGELGPFYLIKDKTFDMANFADKSEVVEERVDGRQYIMKEIKSVLNDVLGLYYIMLPPPEQKKTPEQLWQMAGEFWLNYSSDIDSWFNTATGDFKTKVSEDTQFAFLNLIVPVQISQEAEAKTVRQYIIDRLTY